MNNGERRLYTELKRIENENTNLRGALILVTIALLVLYFLYYMKP